MSSEIVLPPMTIQNAELNTDSNCSILVRFLIGSYTTVYLGTLYLYIGRKAPQRAIVISAITTLYLVEIIQFAVQWFLSLYGFDETSSGAEHAFATLFNSPKWVNIVILATTFSMFVIANGLQIWRCYHACGRSYRMLILSLFLLLIEVVLSLSCIIYMLVLPSTPGIQQMNIINYLQATVFFVSSATSLTAAVLVTNKIYTSAPVPNTSEVSLKGLSVHVIEIIVQSAAIYSAVLLIAAISGVVHMYTTGTFPSPPEFAFSSYSLALLVPAAGLAPTTMVARLSLAYEPREKDDDVMSRSRDGVLSNLEFERDGYSRSTNQNTGTRIDLRMSGNEDSESDDERRCALCSEIDERRHLCKHSRTSKPDSHGTRSDRRPPRHIAT